MQTFTMVEVVFPCCRTDDWIVLQNVDDVDRDFQKLLEN